MVAAIGLASAAVGAASSAGVFGGNTPAGQTTNTQQQTLSPQMQAYLYGDGTAANPGVLGQISAQGTAARAPGSAASGAAADSFVGANTGSSLAGQQAAANGLQGSNISAPTSTAAQAQQGNFAQTVWNQGATVAAPAQNNLDLSSAYNNVINGNAGANPYLTGALQSAVNATNDSYNQNQTSLTNQLQRTILPQINQSAALSGQYGGTRQGIAQGNALSDYTNQLTQANQQLADTNSANTTGAQATAYNEGQDRSLSALNTLSGQQYGVASQDSAQAQQANLQNQSVNNSNQQFNANLQQNSNQYNAGLQQQTGLANQAAQGQTNQLNSANQVAGIGANAGILSAANGYANYNDMYGLNKAATASGALAPYATAGSSSSASSPYYTNPLASAVGGASAGLGLYNAYNQSTGGSSVPGIQSSGYQNFNVSPTTQNTNTGGVFSGFTGY